MKGKGLWTSAGLALFFACGQAGAQSAVVLYGVMDAGITYAGGGSGGSKTFMGTGINSPNLFGMRITESLGGGLNAIATLEGQYGLENGNSIEGLYGRQVFVGLASERWGTLTLGKHYDFSFEMLARERYGAALKYLSLYNLRQGPFGGLGVPTMPGGSLDLDRVGGAERISNSVKYTSPALGGLRFGALYSFGGQGGGLRRDGAYSAGVSYERGALGLAAAITEVRYDAINQGRDGIRTWGVGGRYFFGDVFVTAAHTYTRNTFTGGAVGVWQAGVSSPLAARTTVMLDYQYQRGNEILDKVHAHQLGTTLDYELSRRTDTYIGMVWQLAGGSGAQAWIAGVPGPAQGDRQVMLRVGLRHVF